MVGGYGAPYGRYPNRLVMPPPSEPVMLELPKSEPVVVVPVPLMLLPPTDPLEVLYSVQVPLPLLPLASKNRCCPAVPVKIHGPDS